MHASSKALLAGLLFFLMCSVSETGAAEMSPLTPKAISQFCEIAKFPRPSGHEKAVSDYMVQWAKARNFAVRQDAAHNVIIDKPAAKGYENKPLVILQSHLDMVCVGRNKSYVPEKDPIIVLNDGKTLKAKDTSLGADGAMGLAVAMTLLDSDIPTGALRLIATTEEEVGLRGAKKLHPSVFDGVKYVINVDGERIAEAITGCLGSLRTKAVRQAKTVPPTLGHALRLTASGYLGGHSGDAIMLNRGNPIKTLAYILTAFTKQGVNFELVSFEGGTALNALPNSCTAVILVDQKEKALEIAQEFQSTLAKAHAVTDPRITLEVNAAEKPDAVFAKEDTQAFVQHLMLTYSGLMAMSQEIKNFPAISTNLGVAKAGQGEMSVGTMGRSLFASYVDQLRLAAESTARVTGFTITDTSGYYPWELNRNSKLAKLMVDINKEQNGTEMVITAIAGGLECADFVQKNPSIDVVSIGPNIYNGHSPDEYVEIQSIDMLTRLLMETLARLR